MARGSFKRIIFGSGLTVTELDDFSIKVEAASTGTGGGDTGIFFDVPNEGASLDIVADDAGGVSILSDGGDSAGGGGMILMANAGTSTLKNSVEGVVVYSTGHFASGRITDLSSALGAGMDRPGLILAASDGVVISHGAIDAGEEHGALTLVYLHTDTGNNVLRSPRVLATTSDPHVSGALWNDGGTVKISSG